ncbi:unnamed protein product [Soboliphyme baturini]|uniref:Uncharacterized protein n=1 Tax=Soboliphyme baturini TaxID=241478 RepID=A0A183J7G1_9BILA|nr:unnamed protein product [Soboliphyme baturini]
MRTQPSNVFILRGMNFYFECLQRGKGSCVSDDQSSIIADMLKILAANLLAPYTVIRFYSLRLLKHISSILGFEDVFDFFNIALKIESTPVTYETYRGRLLEYRRIAVFRFPDRILQHSELFLLLPLRILIGQFYVNFAVLWKPLTDIVEEMSRRLLQNVFWPFLAEVLQKANDDAGNYQGYYYLFL